MNNYKEKIIYQFGDTKHFNVIQGPDSFIFPREGLGGNAVTNIKTEYSDSPFSDGDINNLQNKVAFLNANSLDVSFSIDKTYDTNYLKYIFVGRTKKVFFFEYENGVVNRIFANYATCTGGLEGGFSEDVEAEIRTVNLKFVYSKFFEVTNYVNVLDDTALDINEASKWTEAVTGAGWQQATGFGWGEAVPNYSLKFKDLTIEQKKAFLGTSPRELPEKPFDLTWKDTWTNSFDGIDFDNTFSTANTILTNNNLTAFDISAIDLKATAVQTLFKVKLNQTGGLAQNESITIYNPENNSGFTFTWVSPGNSPENILINTALAPEKVFDMDTGIEINTNTYSINYAFSSSIRLLEIDGQYKPYSRPNKNLPVTRQTSLLVQKNTASNLTIELKNLKQFIF
jgi:hypothetical protein